MKEIIVIQVLVIGWAATLHAYHADANQEVIKRGKQKFLLGCIEYAVAFVISVFMAKEGIGSFNILLLFAGVSAALFMPVRWLVHDLVMNIVRGKRWFYVGRESFTDDLQTVLWDFIRIGEGRYGIHPLILKGGLIYGMWKLIELI